MYTGTLYPGCMQLIGGERIAVGEVGHMCLLCRWTIWAERVKALEKFVLDKWEHFTIWNAGKQGKRLYRSLSPQSRAKVLRQYFVIV